MKLLAGVFVGVFVGALAYEIVRKTEFTRKAARKLSDGVQSAKKAFAEGYNQSTEESAGSESDLAIA